MTRRHLLVLALALFVAVATLLPGASAPTAGGFPWDKLLHAAGGAALVLAGAWALRRDDARALAVLALAAALYGGGLELAQALVPSRDPAVLDFLADAAGASLGALGALTASPDP
ncbi:hypothetical protein MBEHAL_0973 [Halarchaeum acidiphilum MH1-52-1]|uniref:VanZ-like domain-containing protein n=1 Tax=Halarchaeum acidiphilum MH1-52-1 TaxID=1261545 RepID=U3ABQ7_9EURY|nr:VanZ family protein [Halarchaeum acidiphilum]GAD52213.1 hypothetical protein MBEHAL_0973 [Halarchaeum acidiphilum MH1-52-1]